MIVLIDNYDSFTWNLVQYLWLEGCEVKVVHNDELDVNGLKALPNLKGLVVSPGPCTPNEAGISMQAIKAFAEEIPVLGVCLGHQAIGAVFGGRVIRAPLPQHGKISQIEHDGTGVFASLTPTFAATRYHSLVVEKSSLPERLRITAWTKDHDPTPGQIMGLQLVDRPVFGVQFHPESIMTTAGRTILGNFVRCCT